MPVRRSSFWKAASASRRSVAGCLVTVPASFLICSSSLIAASPSSLLSKDLSAAKDGTKERARIAAAMPARTGDNIFGTLQRGRDISSTPDGVEGMARFEGEARHSVPLSYYHHFQSNYYANNLTN